MAEPDERFSYRWFSSVGDLVGFTRGGARIEPDAPDSGLGVLVVRDPAAGTSWTIAPATVC